MKRSIILLFLICLINSCQKPSEPPLKPIKNVIVILADDHALKVTGTYGNDLIRTPNIDRLAKEGVKFTNAYCNSPICSASRQSLLTGKYPHATGVNLLFTPFPDESNVTIAEYLRDEGFQTALIGKSHFNNGFWSQLYPDGLPNHGFDTWIENASYQDFLKKSNPPEITTSIQTYQGGDSAKEIAKWMNSQNLPHPIQDEYSQGTFYANEAAKFISENNEKPFFLWTAFFQPHHPYYYPVEYTGKYQAEDMTLPVGSPEDERWIPAKFRELSDQERKGIIAAYYTSTEYMDKNIGIILDAVRENNLEENTMILYISDNGYLLNDHRRFEKHTMWDEAVRQPLIIKTPGNQVNSIEKSALVEYIDIVPTIIEWLGLETMKNAQGSSFLPILNEEKDDHKTFVFSEYLEDNMAMVANTEWKYVFTTGSRDLGIGYQTGFGPSGIVHRLYDLKEDPSESKDVSKNPENRKILSELQNEMLNRFMETHPDAADCPKNLTLEGKLVWFCEPRDIGVDQSLVDKPVRVFQKN